MLQNIPTVINGVRRCDAEAVAEGLEMISQSIQDMTDTLKLMHGSPLNNIYLSPSDKYSDLCGFPPVYVEPSVFYGIMRIFLSG